eukprot:714081_1
MSSLVSFLVSLSCILHTIHSTDFEPTIVNSTGSFWIITPNNFSHGSITCPPSHCHIACNYNNTPSFEHQISPCYELQVYAPSPLTTLFIYCGTSHSAGPNLRVYSGSACQNAVIHANTANSVSLTCDESGGESSRDGGCLNVKLYAGNVQNNVSIHCGSYGCSNAFFNASNIGNSLTVKCDYDAGCSGAYIYGPKDALSNIHCEESDGCSGAQFHTTSESISKNPWNSNFVKIHYGYDYSQSTGAKIVCDDTNLATTFKKTNAIWGCSNFDCCPLGLGSIVCSAGLPCQIDRALAPYSHVDATQAESLTLDCSNGCQGTRIECPTGTNTACNIRCPSSYSCQYAYIQTGTNTINQLDS